MNVPPFSRWLAYPHTRALAAGAALTAFLAGAALWVQWLVSNAGRDRLYDDLEAVPVRNVGLLLGTSRLARSGGENRYFMARIDAGAALYRAGKIHRLILSGDGTEAGYNEPEDMMRALVARGVPAEALVLDPGGVRTIDSVLRARTAFGADRFTVISQQFHNERALFLCRAYDIDAIAFNADAVRKVSGRRTELREILARFVAVWEAYISRRNPDAS